MKDWMTLFGAPWLQLYGALIELNLSQSQKIIEYLLDWNYEAQQYIRLFTNDQYSNVKENMSELQKNTFYR